MASQFLRVLGLALVISPLAAARAATPEKQARDFLEAAGVTGGLVVHVGCDDGKLTADLRVNDRYVVHGLDTGSGSVDAARRHIQSLGVYGNVTVDAFDGAHLPYTDNLVNLLVVSKKYRLSNREMLRVVAPGGVVYVLEGEAWKKTVKRWPEGIDTWTHYLHGPDNNAVARDRVVGPPRHMQWMGGPHWSRNHHKLCSISSV
ncbi:MAG: class I SAM-dependent methyltransferase, partial [Planctomycetota bacterium]